MTHDEIRQFLIVCTIVDYALLMFWFFVFTKFHDSLYRLHSRWFEIPRATFDVLHYALMGLFEIGIMLFILAPLIALHLLA